MKRKTQNTMAMVAGLGVCLAAGWLIFRSGTPEPSATDKIKDAPRGVGMGPSAWPVFRGDQALSARVDGSIPKRPPKLVWSFNAESMIAGTPIVGEGRVFMAASNGRLFALRTTDGAEIWSFDSKESFEASPLLFDGVLYLGGVNGTFFAIDAATGKERWRLKLEDQIKGSANWTVTDDGDGRILVGCYDTRLYCLAANDGKIVWSFKTGNYVNGTPAVSNEEVVFGGCDGFLRILDGTSGEEIRQVDTGSYIPGSPAIAAGVVCVGQHEGTLLCVEIATGAVRWTYGDGESGDGSFTGSPALTDDHVVFCGRDKTVRCLQLATGEAIWTFQTRGDADGAPVIVGDVALVGAADGRFYALALADGRSLWSYEVGEMIDGSPVWVEGRVFLAAAGRLHAFEFDSDAEGVR